MQKNMSPGEARVLDLMEKLRAKAPEIYVGRHREKTEPQPQAGA